MLCSVYTVTKDIVEFLYYLAGIGLFAGLIITYRQLKVMKKDILDTSRRAAVEKSIEYLHWYAETFIPSTDEYYKKLEGKKVINFKNLKEMPFNFNSEVTREIVLDSLNIKKKHVVGLLNELEFFSAAMMSGLADEKLAFTPLAKTYCNFIELNYDVYCEIRKGEGKRLYTNTIELYNMWKERIKHLNLEDQKSHIEAEQAKLNLKAVSPIGS